VYCLKYLGGGVGFTHVDPFEDTERCRSRLTSRHARICFTHVDPFEDTESDAG